MNEGDLPCDFGIQSLMGELAREKIANGRFEPIGGSGYWSLIEWENVCVDTIFDLTKEYLRSKNCGATLNEIFDYVSSKRPGVSRNTVYMYLHTRRDIFEREGRNLYALSKCPPSSD